MANDTLMFEVGIESAEKRLKEIEREFKDASKRMGNILKIKVEMEGVNDLIQHLKSIGDGKVMEPLMRKFDELNEKLSQVGGSSFERRLQIWQGAVERIAELQKQIDAAKNVAPKRYESLTKELNGAVDVKRIQERVLGMDEHTIRAAISGMNTLKQSTDEVSASKQRVTQETQKAATAMSAEAEAEARNSHARQQIIEQIRQEESAWKRLQEIRAMKGAPFDRSGEIAQIEKFLGIEGQTAQMAQKSAQAQEQKRAATEADAKAVQDLLTVTNGLKTACEQLSTALNSIGSGLTLNTSGQNQLAEATSKALQSLTKEAGVFNDLKVAADKIQEAAVRLSLALSQIGDPAKIKQYEQEVERLKKLFDELSKKVNDIGSAPKELTEAQRKAVNEVNLREAIVMYHKLEEALHRYENALAGVKQDEKLNKAIESARRYLSILQEIISKNGELGTHRSPAEMRRDADYRIIFPDAKDDVNRTKAINARTDAEHQYNLTLVKTQLLLERIKILANERSKAGLDVSAHKGAIDSLERLKSLMSGFSNFGDAHAVKEFAQQLALINAQARQFNLKDMSQEFSLAASNMKQAEREAERLTVTISNLEALASKASALVGVDTTQLRAVINELRQYQQALSEIASTNSSSTKALTLSEAFLQAKRNVSDAASAIKKEMMAAMKPDNSLAESYKEYSSVLRQIASLTKTAIKADAVMVDTTKIYSQIAALERYLKVLEAIVNSGGYGITSFKSGVDYQKARTEPIAEQARVQAETTKKVAEEKMRAASATGQQTAEEQKLAHAFANTNSQAQKQSQVLSDLRTMATQYLSVWGAQSFIKNMAQITGELELQRKSLEVIIANAGKAGELYGAIRDLSQQSPYTFQDLLKSTRQLAAFGVQTKDLYSTMKALSDIGAGLSVDVSRLILAYGHVRSFGYLSGIQNRQFETAGVDLIGGLAKYYRQQDPSVTRREVFKRMRNKDISFEDVEKVIMDLDKPGGRFYNMQERQFDTLGGKLRNLRNNYNIMMSEMGQDNKGVLMGGVELLNELTANWEKYATIIKDILVPLGMLKLAMLAVNATAGKQGAVVVNNLKDMARAQNAIRQPIAKGGFFGSFDQGFAGRYGNPMLAPSWRETRQFMTAANKALGEGNISKRALRSMSVDKDLPKTYREAAGRLAGLSKLQAQYNAQLTGMGRSLRSIGYTVSNLGAKIGSVFGGMMSAIANPVTLLMGAIAGITHLIQRNSEMASRAERIADQMRTEGDNDEKEANDLIESVKGSLFDRRLYKRQYAGSGLVKTYRTDFDDDAIRNELSLDTFQELQEKLQAMSPFYQGDLVDIYKMEDQVEQFKAIIKKFESIRHANDVSAATGNIIADAAKDIGSTFSDDLTEDMADFAQRYRQFGTDIMEVTDSTLDNVNGKLGGELDEIQKRLNLGSRADAFREWVYAQYFKDDGGNKKIDGLDGWMFGKNMNKEFVQFADDATRSNKFLRKSLKDQREQLIKDFEEFAPTMIGVLTNYFNDDPDGQAHYLQEAMMKFFSEAKISDPATIDQIMFDFVSVVAQSSGGADIAANMFKKMALEKFQSLTAGMVTESTTGDELNKILEENSAIIIAWAENLFGGKLPDIVKESWRKMFKEGLDTSKTLVDLKSDWQKRAKDIFETNVSVKTKIKMTDSMHDFVKLVQDDLKKKKEYLKFEASHIEQTLRVKFNIKASASFIMDAKQMEGAIKTIKDRIAALRVQGNDSFANTLQNILEREIMPFYESLNAKREDEKYLKAENYPETDPNKDKKKKSGSKGSHEDKEAKRLREEIKLVKDAYSWYKKYQDELKYSPADAFAEIEKKYADILKKVGITWDAEKGITEYSASLRRLLTEAEGLYNTKGHKNSYMLDVIKELKDAITQVGFDDAKKNLKDFASFTKKQLDDLIRRWEIYNIVRESTGDKVMAGQLAGMNGNEPDLRNSANAIRDSLTKAFSDANIDFASVMDMDDEALEKYVSGLGVSHDKVQGLIDALKKWRDLQRNVLKTDISNYAKVVGGLKSYSAEIKKIDDKLRQDKEANNALVGKNGFTQEQADNANNILQTQADWQKMKMSADYANLYNNAIALSRKEFENSAEAVEKLIKRLRELGIISPDEFVQEQQKLNKARQEWSTTGFLGERGAFGQFLAGGNDGLMNYYKARGEAARQRQKNAKEGSEDEANAKKEAEHYEKLNKQLVELTDEAKDLMTAFSTLQSGLSMLSEMFASMGMEGAANTMSDAAGLLGGTLQGASSLSALGPWGMAAGAAVGLTTGLFQLHDKQLAREIEKLRKDVQKIEANTTLILKSRERTLGYDSGDLRRAYALGYTGLNATNLWTGEQVQSKDMRDMMNYYLRNSSGNGYSQQYQNLINERQDYLDILYKQESMKNKSNEDIEETKSKIAELDDQIRFFSEDLAKELWAIDIKGWADQINDALVSAFENGEDMAKAFGDTAKSIMQSVVSEILKIGFIEPMIENLRKKIFGYTDENGNKIVGTFDHNNPQSSMGATLTTIADYFKPGGEGSQMSIAANEFLSGIDQMMKNLGYPNGLKGSSTSTLGDGIQSSMTEETAGVLSGYIAAMRQDLSVIRIMKQMQYDEFVKTYWADYITQVVMIATQLGGIRSDTQTMMQMMRDGNGALYDRVARIETLLNNATVSANGAFHVK